MIAPLPLPTGQSPSPSSRRSRRVLLATLLALGLGMLFAVPAGASAILDGIVQTYQASSGHWLERVGPLARQLFALLAALEFIVSGILWVIEARPVEQILRSYVYKVLVLGFFWTLIVYFPSFVPKITAGFERAGQEASEQFAVSPSEVVEQGMAIVAELFASLNTTGLVIYPSGLLLYTLVALLVLLAFVSIAAQLVLVLVEAYVVVSGGIFFLGFAGFRSTAPIADNYLLYAVGVGVKIFLLYLLVGVGVHFTGDWSRQLHEATALPPNFRPALEVLAGSLIYAFLVWRIPGQVAAQITGNAQLRLRDALTR